jgi:hypothetical protein
MHYNARCFYRKTVKSLTHFAPSLPSDVQVDAELSGKIPISNAVAPDGTLVYHVCTLLQVDVDGCFSHSLHLTTLLVEQMSHLKLNLTSCSVLDSL